ncbi:MAG: hypothetical protein ACTHWF_12900 [Brachybacterium sp.]
MKPGAYGDVHLAVADVAITVSFGVGLEAVFAEVCGLWSHLRVEQHSKTADVALSYVAEGVPRGEEDTSLKSQPAASYFVSGAITRAVILELIGSRLLLHAGAIRDPNLGVVVLVGPSGAGKSTATRELSRDAEYLTDELTIIDPAGFAITSYPKPLSQMDRDLGVKRDFSLGEAGLSYGLSAPPPTKLVLLDRDGEQLGSPERSGRVERVPLIDAVMKIVPQTSSLWGLQGGLASLAELVTVTGGALRVQYHDATELSALLAAAPPPVTEEWETLASGDEYVECGKGEYAVAPFREALIMEGGLVVLARQGVVRLSGIAGLIWDMMRLGGGMSLDEIEEGVIEELGPPPADAHSVAAVVDDLVSSGWVRRG